MAPFAFGADPRSLPGFYESEARPFTPEFALRQESKGYFKEFQHKEKKVDEVESYGKDPAWDNIEALEKAYPLGTMVHPWEAQKSRAGKMRQDLTTTRSSSDSLPPFEKTGTSLLSDMAVSELAQQTIESQHRVRDHRAQHSDRFVQSHSPSNISQATQRLQMNRQEPEKFEDIEAKVKVEAMEWKGGI